MTTTDINLFLPELLLAVFAMFGLIYGVFAKSENVVSRVHNMAIIALAISAFFVYSQSSEISAFNEMFIVDQFSRYLKLLILLSTVGVLLSSVIYLKRINIYNIEFPILVALAAMGMMIMVSATNLMSLYIGLELQSLALYVLAAFRRDNTRSSEAGMKYFVLGALSSGLFLFGASLVYGFTGATNYEDIANATVSELNIGVVFGLAFLMAAIAFKISAAPFHMWTPDVYQGAPTAVTAFFATAPKVAAFGMLARLCFEPFVHAGEAVQQILVLLALVSVFVGAIAAIGQTNIKRLLAFSSVLNMGFVLLSLASGKIEGVSSALIFLTIYVFMTLAIFAFVMSMERDGKEVVELRDLGMLSLRAPLVAIGVATIMWSMAGIPPLAGFVGKLLILQVAVNNGLVWLAVATVIASAIGAFYYLRMVYLMYFGDEPLHDHERKWTFSQGLVFAVGTILMYVWILRLFVIENASIIAADALIG